VSLWVSQALVGLRAQARTRIRPGTSHHRPVAGTRWPTAPVCAAILITTGALFAEAITAQMVAVSVLYVAVVLTGFWFPRPKAPLALAGIVTAMIVVGYWVAIPDGAPAWEAWTNRALAIFVAWVTALFAWHIRGLEEKLKTEVAITTALSRELNHRVGNSLQLVASFLQLQAAKSSTESSRQVLQAAISRVMTIGRMQRTLSHIGSTSIINSQEFLTALTDDLRSTLPDPERVKIIVEAHNTRLSSATAVALGAAAVEISTNALKHAFREGMRGTIAIRFKAAETPGQYVLEVEDDGIGIDPSTTPDGFGTRNVAELARLMQGSVTHHAARPASSRPGTIQRLVFSVVQ
jgi:two-component sensor histidine kinase